MHRRGFITGLISLIAAPAIVRAGSLMPTRQMLIILERSIDELFALDPTALSDTDLLKIINAMRQSRARFLERAFS